MDGSGLHKGVSTAEAARIRVAARPGTPAATLLTLAQDESITVRAAVALNPTHAPDADKCLVSDPDERVRALLATRLATLLPTLGAAGQQDAQEHVHTTLRTLANDAASRVRAAISDTLNRMPQAPRDLVLRLATDPVEEVSDPVLRLSPLLTDVDLIEILATPPFAGAACSIAGRSGLSATVADHIARHGESPAVRVLLQNHSAAIQEATLDGLVGRAAEHPEWHEPLARRPTLPLRAVRALSRYVAGHVIDALAARPGLPPAMIEELRARTETALDEAPALASEAEIVERVRRMTEAGALTEASLLAALASGDHRLAAAILAAASGTTLVSLDRAIALRSSKALISLVWKAGFSMRAAAQVQAALAHLAPGDVVPAAQHNAYPLSGDEMEWQIELLAEPGR